jgi:hypothetical protein
MIYGVRQGLTGICSLFCVRDALPNDISGCRCLAGRLPPRSTGSVAGSRRHIGEFHALLEFTHRYFLVETSDDQKRDFPNSTLDTCHEPCINGCVAGANPARDDLDVMHEVTWWDWAAFQGAPRVGRSGGPIADLSQENGRESVADGARNSSSGTGIRQCGTGWAGATFGGRGVGPRDVASGAIKLGHGGV